MARPRLAAGKRRKTYSVQLTDEEAGWCKARHGSVGAACQALVGQMRRCETPVKIEGKPPAGSGDFSFLDVPGRAFRE